MFKTLVKNIFVILSFLEIVHYIGARRLSNSVFRWKPPLNVCIANIHYIIFKFKIHTMGYKM